MTWSPTGRPISTRVPNIGASQLLANWIAVIQNHWTKVSVGFQPKWTQLWFGLRMTRSISSRGVTTGSLTLTGSTMLAVIIYDLVYYQTNDYEHFNLPGLRQWTPATLVQYPTGRFTLNIHNLQNCWEPVLRKVRMNDLMFRGSHQTLTPLFSTATAGLTSSKMDNIIALTTQGKLLHDVITCVGGKREWYENEIGRFGQNSQDGQGIDDYAQEARGHLCKSKVPKVDRHLVVWMLLKPTSHDFRLQLW